MMVGRAVLILLGLATPAFAGDLERGAEAMKRGEYDLAIASFTTYIQVNPGSAIAYGIRGSAYSKKEEYSKAIEDYSQAIRLDPKMVNAWYSRGLANKLIKEYEKAIEDYSQAIRLNPKYFMAYNNLAWTLSTCPKDSVRNGMKAVEYAKKACELTEWKDVIALDTLAAAYAESENFKEAIKWQLQANFVGFGRNKLEQQNAAHRLSMYELGKPYREE